MFQLPGCKQSSSVAPAVTCIQSYTVEPPNNGHIGGPAFLSFIERLSSLWMLKCTSIIEKRPLSVSFIARFIVSFIWSVHYKVLLYTSYTLKAKNELTVTALHSL